MQAGSLRLSQMGAFALVAAALVFLAAGSAVGGVNEWSSDGPVGGSITGIAVDPNNPTRIFVSTDGGGIFRTSDSGATWDAANTGQNNLNLTGLALAPSNPDTLYSFGQSSGVYRTSDGGDLWESKHNGLPAPSQVRALAVHPANPDVVYAATQTGVYKTTAAGGVDPAWTLVGSTASGFDASHLNIRAIAHHPDAPDTVFALSGFNPTSGEQPVYVSTNNGESWTRVNAGVTTSGPTGFPNALVINPETPTTMYAGTFAGLWRTTDSGANWTQIANSATTGVHTNTINSIALERLDPGGRVYLATPFGFSWAVDPPDVPDADDWTLSNPLNTALGINTNAQVVALNPDDSLTVYGGTTSFGVLKSDDAAATWAEANGGLVATNVDGLRVAPSAPRTVYASMSNRGSGVVKSTDAGATWARTKLARPARGIAVDPTDPDTVLVATDNGMFRTTDGGMATAWASVNTGLPGTPPNLFAVAFDPANPDTAYAGLLSDGIYKSTNGGDSWAAMNTGLPATRPLIRGFAVDPSTPATVYANTNGGVYKTVDGGGSWELRSDSGVLTGVIMGLAIDPTTPLTLYAGKSGGVYKSVDGAENWTLETTGLTETNVSGIAIDPDDPDTLYASTSGGPALFRSTDAAGSWEPFNTGLDNPFVNALAIDAVTGTFLYAATAAGVFTQIVDTTPPSDVLLGGTALDRTFQLAKQFQVSWSGQDGQTGISSYTLEKRLDNQAFVPEPPTSGTGPVTVSGGLGQTVCLRVTAEDEAGNTTASDERCTAIPFDDRKLTRSRGWTKKTRSGYYENTYLTTTKKGANLKKTLVDADEIALVVTKCRGCGTLAVFWQNVKIAKVPLSATKTRKKQLVEVADFAAAEDGLLKLVVTSSGRPVHVDGLGVLRGS